MKPNLHRRRWGELSSFRSPAAAHPSAPFGGQPREHRKPIGALRFRRAVAAAMAILMGCVLVSTRTALAQSQSYTVTNLPGWNLIANQLDGANGNFIGNLLGSAPLGSRVLKWVGGTFQSSILTAGGGWQPSILLNPGDGVEFSNSSAANYMVTFSGFPHIPVFPPTNGGFSSLILLARQTNGVANPTNIMGFNPPKFTVVYQFIPGANHNPAFFVSSNYTIYTLTSTGWTTPPGAPSNIHVGESVWITTNGSAPQITVGPQSQTACPGGPATFTAAATGTPTPSFQWFHNGNLLGGATTTLYSIGSALSTDAGTYSVVVSNAFGTTSSNATLVVADTTPPTLTCPSNITQSCRGPGGNKISFSVGITDNCDTNPTVVSVPPSGSTFPEGTTTVVNTGFDSSGNSNVCTFTITITDNQPPSITCPPDLAVAAVGPQGARVRFAASATDNCDPNPSVTATPPSGTTFPLGTTPVTAVAKDANGNSNSCGFNITVVPSSCCQNKVWTLKDVSSPQPRLAHSMAYDSIRGRVVLFGGYSSGQDLGDTWEWDGTSWSLMATSGPSPRYFSAMAYDSRLGRTVLYGGYNDVTGMAASDTWLWDGNTWQLVNTAVTPGPRYDHAMGYDTALDQVVLFGGVSGTTGSEVGDTWIFDGTQWTSPTNVPGPGPRTGMAMAYGSILARPQGQLLMFGGEKQGTYFGDTWRWDSSAWTLIASNGPAPRAFHAMAYNDNCESVVLYGGTSSNTSTLSDTWEWDGATWSLAATNLPPGRSYHAMAHDSAHNQTVLFAGSGGQGNDTWIYAPSGGNLQVLSTYAVCGDQKLVVAFSAPVDPASAENVGSYLLSCSGVQNPVVQVVLTDDPRIVWVYAAQPLSSDPLKGNCCNFTINGVRDLCGHTLRQYSTTVCCTVEPCTRGSAGPEYWLTFPGNYAPDPTNPPAPQLFIAGAVGVVGTVSMPGLATPFSAPFSIPAGGVAVVTLPRDADLGDANDVVETNGIHVVAGQPVSVYGHNHIRYTTDSYLGLATKALGSAYLVMAYSNVFTGVPELNGSQFALVATVDNTTVTIVPRVAVGVHAPGVPFNVVLMRGQTYQLRDTNNYPADLTGTLITSDQPIAVFGSHQCANIPNNTTFFCDYIVEQLTPTDLWGVNFITVPLATRLSGDTFRILAMLNGTTVKVNGVPIGTINQGASLVTQLFSAAQITATAPVLVAQFSDSSDYDGVTNSDPFMVLVPPTPLYASSYIVESPTIDFGTNYINVMASAAAVGQIVLDGAVIPVAAFSAVGASGYSSARRPVIPGPHTLFSSNAAPFGIIVYGWNLYDSYGYPGGMCNLPQITTNRFICPQTNTVIQAGQGCMGVMPDLRGSIGNGSLALYIIQTPPPGALLGPGTYGVTFTIVDQNGQRSTCQTSITVNPPTTGGLTCPPNVVTNCNGTNGQFVFFQATTCNTNATISYSKPPGSFFPPGVTPVLVTASNVFGIEQCTFTVNVNCVTVGITHSATPGSVVVSWTGTGTLQKATAVTGPWLSICNAVSPYTISVSGTTGFFRVKQ